MILCYVFHLVWLVQAFEAIKIGRKKCFSTLVVMKKQATTTWSWAIVDLSIELKKLSFFPSARYTKKASLIESSESFDMCLISINHFFIIISCNFSPRGWTRLMGGLSCLCMVFDSFFFFDRDWFFSFL